jgi:hypothetical protein
LRISNRPTPRSRSRALNRFSEKGTTSRTSKRAGAGRRRRLVGVDVGDLRVGEVTAHGGGELGDQVRPDHGAVGAVEVLQ